MVFVWLLATLQISAAWAGTEECGLAIFEQTRAIFQIHTNMRPEQTLRLGAAAARGQQHHIFALTVDPRSLAAVRVCVYECVLCVCIYVHIMYLYVD